MSKGWNAYVYRTDLEEEAYCGFFFDDVSAGAWIKKQEGTYEVSDVPPSKRKTSAEEADSDRAQRTPEEHPGVNGDVDS